MKKIFLTGMVAVLLVGCGDGKYTYDECQESYKEIVEETLEELKSEGDDPKRDVEIRIESYNKLQKLKYDHGCRF
jgi:coenzyme F420-reducing hydrogenase delta subunit